MVLAAYWEHWIWGPTLGCDCPSDGSCRTLVVDLLSAWQEAVQCDVISKRRWNPVSGLTFKGIVTHAPWALWTYTVGVSHVLTGDSGISGSFGKRKIGETYKSVKLCRTFAKHCNTLQHIPMFAFAGFATFPAPSRRPPEVEQTMATIPFAYLPFPEPAAFSADAPCSRFVCLRGPCQAGRTREGAIHVREVAEGS